MKSFGNEHSLLVPVYAEAGTSMTPKDGNNIFLRNG